jgi:hypothetical protein
MKKLALIVVMGLLALGGATVQAASQSHATKPGYLQMGTLYNVKGTQVYAKVQEIGGKLTLMTFETRKGSPGSYAATVSEDQIWVWRFNAKGQPKFVFMHYQHVK